MTRATRRKLRISRDATLFMVGLAGVLHETLISKVDRPTLLLLFAGMIGLPTFLRGDEHSQERGSGDRDE